MNGTIRLTGLIYKVPPFASLKTVFARNLSPGVDCQLFAIKTRVVPTGARNFLPGSRKLEKKKKEKKIRKRKKQPRRAQGLLYRREGEREGGREGQRGAEKKHILTDVTILLRGGSCGGRGSRSAK